MFLACSSCACTFDLAGDTACGAEDNHSLHSRPVLPTPSLSLSPTPPHPPPLQAKQLLQHSPKSCVRLRLPQLITSQDYTQGDSCDRPIRIHQGRERRKNRATQFSSVQFRSVQDGIYALGKSHMRAPPRLSGVSPMLPF